MNSVFQIFSCHFKCARLRFRFFCCFLKGSVDVNVTPDKRQIFVEGEQILLATLKVVKSVMCVYGYIYIWVTCHHKMSLKNSFVVKAQKSN